MMLGRRRFATCLLLVTAYNHICATVQAQRGGPLNREQVSAIEELIRSRETNSSTSRRLLAETWSIWPKRVNTYFHIINDKKNRAGFLTDNLVKRQIKTLNAAFKDVGLIFDLKKINRVKNDDWSRAKPGSDEELKMKKKLRKGTLRDLNIYAQYSLGKAPKGGPTDPEQLGLASFPWDVEFGIKNAEILDDVTISYLTMPTQKAIPYYSRGYNLVMQVGHWVGLLNTFDGSTVNAKGTIVCNRQNDLVSDTPPECLSIDKDGKRCPTCNCPRQTCRARNGRPWRTCNSADPVDNFMTYTPDTCKKRFTAGQIERARQYFNLFRERYAVPPPKPGSIYSCKKKRTNGNESTSQKTCTDCQFSCLSDRQCRGIELGGQAFKKVDLPFLDCEDGRYQPPNALCVLFKKNDEIYEVQVGSCQACQQRCRDDRNCAQASYNYEPQVASKDLCP